MPMKNKIRRSSMNQVSLRVDSPMSTTRIQPKSSQLQSRRMKRAFAIRRRQALRVSCKMFCHLNSHLMSIHKRDKQRTPSAIKQHQQPKGQSLRPSQTSCHRKDKCRHFIHHLKRRDTWRKAPRVAHLKSKSTEDSWLFLLSWSLFFFFPKTN